LLRLLYSFAIVLLSFHVRWVGPGDAPPPPRPVCRNLLNMLNSVASALPGERRRSTFIGTYSNLPVQI
jgi:hypothetical protein